MIRKFYPLLLKFCQGHAYSSYQYYVHVTKIRKIVNYKHIDDPAILSNCALP